MILIPKFFAYFGLYLKKKSYHRPFISKYVKNANSPSLFDNRIDLYDNWLNNLLWLERGKHLSENDNSNAINKIKSSLSNDGTLFGSTPIIKEENPGGNREHDNEFTSVNQLNQFLSKDIHEISIYTDREGKIRKTAYFSCGHPIC